MAQKAELERQLDEKTEMCRQIEVRTHLSPIMLTTQFHMLACFCSQRNLYVNVVHTVFMTWQQDPCETGLTLISNPTLSIGHRFIRHLPGSGNDCPHLLHGPRLTQTNWALSDVICSHMNIIGLAEMEAELGGGGGRGCV